MKRLRTCPILIAAALALVASAAHAAPPAGKTYFAVFVGLEAPYSQTADCVRFTRTEICTSDGACGVWVPTEPGGEETAFRFDITLDLEGRPAVLECRARIDNRGKGDSLGAVGTVRVGGKRFNLALTGRSLARKKCVRLLEAWRGES